METVGAALTRYGRSDLLADTLEGVLAGDLVGCFGASEPAGGSDINGIGTTAVRDTVPCIPPLWTNHSHPVSAPLAVPRP